MSVKVIEAFDLFYVAIPDFGMINVLDNAEEANKFATSKEAQDLEDRLSKVSDRFTIGYIGDELYLSFEKCYGNVELEVNDVYDVVNEILAGDWDEAERECIKENPLDEE